MRSVSNERSLPAGTQIGSYTVIALLGSGEMGVVYRARDERLGRNVALKILPDVFAKDPDRVARFEREAKAVAALSHPNILGIYEFGNSEGVAFAAMELLEGETLRARLDAGPLAGLQGDGLRNRAGAGAGSGARARDYPSRSEAPKHIHY